MDKGQIATILEDIANLLELKGENPFKTRAYHNGARIVAGISEDLAMLVREKKLSEIKGIGPGLNESISILVTTGKLPYYEELLSGLPPGLLEMIRVQGVGPKRAKILYDKLKIKDVAGLEKAAKDGRIAGLKGFGEMSQENILKGISFLGQHAEYHRYDAALASADKILAELKQLASVKRISICGSLRRHREVIRDVDILVSSDDAPSIMKHLIALPEVERILGQGETKSSVLLNTGIQVDVRVVDDKAYPFALHYFTGSKEHNIVMRQRAQKLGYKLNEYALLKNDTKPTPCKDEKEIFAKLGLAYIPPEMREDRGEFAAAEKGKLPKLVELADIQGVFHVHSTWSDGAAALDDMIAAAEAQGWSYVGISDHSKTAAYAHGLTEDRVELQYKEIQRLRKKFKIHIFWGTECDILKDGSMDYSDDLLARYDFVIASVHSVFNLAEAEMTQRIVKALRHPSVSILGHMTGRLLLEREGYQVNAAEIVAAAAGEGKSIELNASPKRLDIDWRLLELVRDKKVPVSINPDAHSVKGLEVVRYGVGMARKGWLTKSDVLNTRSLAAISTWLKK